MAGSESLRVWIDQDLCTGDALCTEIATDVFEMGDDNLAYVLNAAGKIGKAGLEGAAEVTDGELIECVVEAAEECPGECIFVEAA